MKRQLLNVMQSLCSTWTNKRSRSVIVIIALISVLLFFHDANGQKKMVIEWEYTFVGGCTRLPEDILLIGAGTTVRIYKAPTYNMPPGYEDYSNYTTMKTYTATGSTWSNVWIAVGYKNNEGKCPGLGAGLPCYKDEIRYLTFNLNDPCVWPETIMTICGFNNFKMRVNISSTSGENMTQLTTAKPYYCPGETVTFEVPCNMKGHGPYSWYYQEGTGSMRFLKTTTTETITAGTGYDLTPTPGVNTFFRVSNTLHGFSNVSSSFRFGAPPPSATLDPQPPQCADGDDWHIDLTGVDNSVDAVTTFKANIFHSLNTSSIPDGYVTFTEPSGSITLSQIVSSRTFVPGTSFKVTIENAHDISNYGACATDLGSSTIPNKLKITATEISGSHVNLSCYNVTNGEIQLDVANGDGNYTVKFDDVAKAIKPGSPTHKPIISGLDGGTYKVKVSDTHCESDEIDITLTEPTELTASIEVLKTLDCSYSTDGQLKVNVGGGTTPYTITWSNGQSGATATGFAKGTHTVTIKDAGCAPITRNQELTAPPAITFGLQDTSPTCPEGDNGRMKVVNLQNAPGLVQYSWNTGGTSDEIIALTAGAYTVTVTSTNAGKVCSETKSKDVIDPIPWTVDIVPALVYHGVAIKCNGESNGRLDAIVRNDLGQIVDGESYLWSNGQSGTTKKFIDGLAEGNYGVSVRYKGICQAVDNFSLIDPDPVDPTINITSDYNGFHLSCNGASDAHLEVNTTGGTNSPNYTYVWNTTETSRTIHDKPSGIYHISVKDINGCEGLDTIEVVDPPSVSISVIDHSDYNNYGVSCFGGNNGRITTLAEGGTSTYVFKWTTGQNTATITDLSVGTYSIQVADANGCTDSTGYVITEPPLLKLEVADSRDPLCYEGADGYVHLAAKGGVPEYRYAYKNPIHWQSEPLFPDLAATYHTFIVEDKNGCRESVLQVLDQPTALEVTFSGINPAFCEDPIGAATGVVTGGSPGYQYEWRNTQNQALATTAAISGLSGGLYTLYVTDSHECPASSTVAITSTDGAKTTHSAIDAKCFYSADGSAEVAITAGEGPFTIEWPDGNNTSSAAGLTRGIYNVVITDARNCAVVEPVIVSSPPVLVLSTEKVQPTCNASCDGQITLTATGGAGNYTYAWNNSTSPALTGLCAGKYGVTVTDQNNCILTEEIELTEPGELTVQLRQKRTPTCKDGCDGLMEARASGGNGGFQYQWTNGPAQALYENVCAGTYTIQVTDVKGCTGENTFIIENTPAVNVGLSEGATVCEGQVFDLDAGTQWTSHTWSSGGTTISSERIVQLQTPGLYILDVISRAGCAGRDTFLLETSNSLLEASFLTPEEAHVFDTVVFVDISWPVPERTEWQFPEQMRKLVDGGYIVYGQFFETGTYNVGIKTYLGKCLDQVTKTISILDGEVDPEGGRLGFNAFVKSIALHPVPNDGAFDVEVTFAEQSPVTFSVWGVARSVLVGKKQASGSDHYKEAFDLRPLSPGVYVLRIDHAKGSEYKRFLVY